jgi:hypothetical protein
VARDSLRARLTRGHALNDASSRTHVCLSIHIDTGIFDRRTKKPVIGRIDFVDLAGSERIKVRLAATSDRRLRSSKRSGRAHAGRARRPRPCHL